MGSLASGLGVYLVFYNQRHTILIKKSLRLQEISLQVSNDFLNTVLMLAARDLNLHSG